MPQPTYTAPAPPQAQLYAAQPGGMPPAKKKTSPIVWVLLIVGALFVVGVLGVVGLGMFALHKVRQAGFDPELMRSNPGLAVSKMIAASNPDVEVLDTNDRAGTITVRDRKTGKVVKMSFDDVKNGHFNMRFQEDGKTASMDFGSDVAARLPSWVPAYPGADSKGGFSARSSGANGEQGNFTFTTSDSADKVRSFYEDKAKSGNLESDSAASSGFGSVLAFRDASTGHKLTVTILGGAPTTVSVTYETK